MGVTEELEEEDVGDEEDTMKEVRELISPRSRIFAAATGSNRAL